MRTVKGVESMLCRSECEVIFPQPSARRRHAIVLSLHNSKVANVANQVGLQKDCPALDALRPIEDKDQPDNLLRHRQRPPARPQISSSDPKTATPHYTSHTSPPKRHPPHQGQRHALLSAPGPRPSIYPPTRPLRRRRGNHDATPLHLHSPHIPPS